MFDYSKLDGKITELFGTRKNFAKAIGWSQAAVSNKFRGKTDFNQKEIELTIKLLGINEKDISLYFFAKKV